MRGPTSSLFLPLYFVALLLVLGASTALATTSPSAKSASLVSESSATTTAIPIPKITAAGDTTAITPANPSDDGPIQIIPITKVALTKALLPKTTQEVVKRVHHPHRHNHTQTQTSDGTPTAADVPREFKLVVTLVMLGMAKIFGIQYVITGLLVGWVVATVVRVVQVLMPWVHSVGP